MQEALKRYTIDGRRVRTFDDFVEAARAIGMRGIEFRDREQALTELTTLLT